MTVASDLGVPNRTGVRRRRDRDTDAGPSVLLEALPPVHAPHPPVAAIGGPTEDQIRERAYEIYLNRGDRPGSPESDWAQAERELRLGARAA